MGRLGAAAAAATLALYAALQAVDGVALKQAVNAWASAPDAEKAARFASAEAIRWLEWGMRSYQDFTLGLALLLFAASALLTAWLPRPIAYLMGLSGLTHLTQGWVAGSEGFSPTQSVAIVLAWTLSLMWMIWLAVVAWRMEGSDLSKAWAAPQPCSCSSSRIVPRVQSRRGAMATGRSSDFCKNDSAAISPESRNRAPGVK
ncbi:hypothetical protein [Mesorhizobium sp. 131-2-1]|uniref:hypothetical protein n=1 Tax=Mesorhizobium sp. 131-2-1 TaxID=2744518 RepID=UPI00192856C3|nr:hypothetical protein [Mesorhizobium sp. 131-2-1]BCG94134.1 hypothetical protein MesoLj131a_29980 [Mesorhizobium sp. 131-2-1]